MIRKHYKYAVISDYSILDIRVSDNFIPHSLSECYLLDVDIEIDGPVITVYGQEQKFELFFKRNFDSKTIAKCEDDEIEYTSIRKRPYVNGVCKLKESKVFKMISSSFTLTEL